VVVAIEMSGKVYVGVAHVELHLPEARSLKAKRAPVRSLVERIKARHRVLVIEADNQNLYQRTSLAVCALSTDPVDLEARLQRVVNTVDRSWSGHVLSCEIEVADMTATGNPDLRGG
jgi:uncharacterized protein YlxP (DUF503 family)